MRARPDDLADDAVLAAVAEGWGVEAASCTYRPVGFGSHHWEVEDAGGERWFVTVDELRTHDWLDRLQAALRTTRAVADAGGGFAVAPMPALDGDVVRPLAPRFAIAVYPFLDGLPCGDGEYRTMADRLGVLELVTALHTIDAGCRRHALVERFEIRSRAGLLAALDHTDRAWESGPFGEEARCLLAAHGHGVVRLLAVHDERAAAARAQPERMVLTHGEPHTENVLVVDDRLLLIDWDTALIAPPERDLWMLESGDGTVSRAYTDATGVAVRPEVLELYALRWDLMETALYITELNQPHADNPNTRESLANLRVFLDPAGRWPSLL